MKMRVDDSETKEPVVTRTAAERRRIGEHDSLVKAYRREYLEGGSGASHLDRMEELRSKLSQFKGRRVGGRLFLTDWEELEDRLDRDVLEPDGPYDID